MMGTPSGEVPLGHRAYNVYTTPVRLIPSFQFIITESVHCFKDHFLNLICICDPTVITRFFISLR